MISSLERRVEVSVYWPPNPAIICQAQQYSVQMTAMPTSALLSVRAVQFQGIWQYGGRNGQQKSSVY